MRSHTILNSRVNAEAAGEVVVAVDERAGLAEAEGRESHHGASAGRQIENTPGQGRTSVVV